MYFKDNKTKILKNSLYLNRNGYDLPTNFNPADFYIMNLAIIPAEKEECLARVNVSYY